MKDAATKTGPEGDPLRLYGTEIQSRLLLGTARYPSPATLSAAVAAAGTEVLTVSLRREAGGGDAFWQLVRATGARVLPNTAGCRSVREAVSTARMARELFETPWIKLEITADDDSLAPDLFATVEAAETLCAEGFEVFPYMSADLGAASRLVAAGCRVLMPWASPIGSAQGVVDPGALRALRARFPDVSLIVDAGLGRPSHAAQVLELGYDGVLLNTAVAKAGDPVAMAGAFGAAVAAGRAAYLAGALEPRDMAVPSTPVAGTPFWGP